MIRLGVPLTLAFARVLFRIRLELLVENLALREQAAVFKQQHCRPILRRAVRIFRVLLRCGWDCSWGWPGVRLRLRHISAHSPR